MTAVTPPLGAPLPPAAVEEAARALSEGERYFYTTRNLYYELARRGALPAPRGDSAPALEAFDHAILEHERAHGRLSRLIRLTPEMLETRELPSPEVLDFAVPRILIFDRMDLFLFFARNGFYRKIEMALVLWPDFPSYVWQSVLAQLDAGITTTFYLVHDANRGGYQLEQSVRAALAERGPPDVADLGLTFGQAFQLGVPVRSEAPGGHLASWGGFESESELLLAEGACAHIEELSPLALLRWTYARVAQGHEENGFG